MKDRLRRLFSDIGTGKSKDMYEAIRENDCAYVLQQFFQDVDMHVVDERQETFLHKAAKYESFEMFDLLMQLGLDVNAKNMYSETPFHLAVQFQHPEIVQHLVFHDAKINALDSKCIAPLHLAASRGNENILHTLIQNGAKININDENGAKPIHYAVKSGKKEVIRFLLNSGASLIECDNRKNNVLHHACLKGDDNLVAYILRHMVVSDSKNIFGETPLHFAAVHCSVATIKLLLQMGYDLEAKSITGLTPLDFAQNSYNYENLDYLRMYQRSPEYKEAVLDYPIHRSVRLNLLEYIKQTVRKNNADEKDYFGRTPLYYAINAQNIKITEYLLKKGASIENIDEHHQSAMLLANYTENIAIINLLIAYKGNVNEVYYDRTYLYRAILRNNVDLCRVLIKHGADIHYIDQKHRTVYSYAMDYANDEIIGLLLEQKGGMI